MYRDEASMGSGAGSAASRSPALLPPGRPVFFAIRPGPFAATDTDRVCGKLYAAHRLSGKPLTLDRLHITILYLGEAPSLHLAMLDRVREVAAGVTWRPFDIVFDCARSLFHRGLKRPFVLIPNKGNAAPFLFQRELAKTMANAGLMHGRPPRFTPHVTLVWDSAWARDTPLDATVTWVVREFQLVLSVFGESRHECLGRWPLKG